MTTYWCEVERGYFRGTSGCGACKPVVVVDPGNDSEVDSLRNALSEAQSFGEFQAALREFQAALREFANPKQPKPEEPTGRYAVVEDAEGQEWCRVDPSNGYVWQLLGQPDGRCRYDMWRNIDAVEVLSPGVPVE